MKRIASRIRNVGRDAEGGNLLEGAIITPLLLLLTFAIVDFSAMLYVHLALQNGVAQASRYAVTGNVRPGMTREQSIKAVMREATPTLTLTDGAFSFSNLPPGGAGWVGRPRRRERHRQSSGHLHLDDSHAGAPAVLQPDERSTDLHRRIGHEE